MKWGQEYPREWNVALRTHRTIFSYRSHLSVQCARCVARLWHYYVEQVRELFLCVCLDEHAKHSSLQRIIACLNQMKQTKILEDSNAFASALATEKLEFKPDSGTYWKKCQQSWKNQTNSFFNLISFVFRNCKIEMKLAFHHALLRIEWNSVYKALSTVTGT